MQISALFLPRPAGAAIFAALLFSCPIFAQTVRFHIPAKPLPDALIDFAVQADVSIGRSGLTLRRTRSTAVNGSMTLEAGLQLLLQGTEFEYQLIDRHTVRIVGQRRTQSAPLQPAQKPVIEQAVTPALAANIVVTATKRSGFVDSLPYSIGVVSRRDLQETGASGTRDAALQAAGVIVTNLGVGRNKIIIRGISDGVFTGQTQSAVSVYLDDTRLIYNAPDPNLRLVDIDRIEVLRGPQGTLYGAGTLGGVFRIVSAKPSLTDTSARIAGSLAMTDHGGISTSGEAVINWPIIENRLGLRAVGYHQRDAGYIDNPQLGLKNVNRDVTSGGRVTLLLQPSDSWTVSLKGVVQDIASADSQYVDKREASLIRSTAVREPHDNDFHLLDATINGEWAWGHLVSSSAYLMQTTDNINDASLAVPAFAMQPVTPAAFDEQIKTKLFTHETRLMSRSGSKFSWLAGGFLSQGKQERQDILATISSQQTLYLQDRKDDVTEHALFGEASYLFAPAWSVTIGLRWSRSSVIANSITLPASGAAVKTVDLRSELNGVTPKIVVSFHPNEGALVYAQIAEGYRAGGINTDVPDAVVQPVDPEAPANRFRSDRLWNYEIGGKFTLIHDRLHIQTALFFSEWDNIQTDQILPNGLSFTANAGNGRNFGLEVAAELRPVEGLTLRGNMLLNKPELYRPNPAFVSQTEAGLPGVPKISFGLFAEYDAALSDTTRGFINLGYSFSGRTSLTFDAVTAPRSDRFGTTNLRLGVSRSNWRVLFYASNVLNEKDNSFAFGNPFSLRFAEQATPPRPRTIGLSLEKTF